MWPEGQEGWSGGVGVERTLLGGLIPKVQIGMVRLIDFSSSIPQREVVCQAVAVSERNNALTPTDTSMTNIQKLTIPSRPTTWQNYP